MVMALLYSVLVISLGPTRYRRYPSGMSSLMYFSRFFDSCCTRCKSLLTSDSQGDYFFRPFNAKDVGIESWEVLLPSADIARQY
jgi:hypothetical protein